MRGQVDRYKDWVELCHDAALPPSIEIFDTTLRDGAQFEGISLTVEDKLKRRRAARLARRGLDRGRLPPGQPEGRGVLPAGRHRAAPRHGHPRGLRLHPSPAGKVDVDPTLAALVGAGTSTVCIVGKSWDFHVTEALGTTLDEGVAMVGESVAFLKAAGPAGLLRRRALLRRLQGQPRVRPAGARGGGHQRRRLPRAVRHQRRVAAPRGAAHHRRGLAPTSGRPAARHPHPERLRLRRGQLRRRRPRRGHPAPGHDQRLRRAHRQRQPDDLHPEPRAEARHPVPARGSPRAAHRREPPRGRAGEPAARTRPTPTSGSRPSPTRADSTPPPSARRAAPPTSTSSPSWSATAPGCWSPTSAVGPAWR